MGIAADIAVLLRAESTVTAAISGKTTGVYAGSVPQQSAGTVIKPPHIAITVLTTDFHNTLEGTGAVATGVKKATIDIDCRGVTESDADDIKQAVAVYFDDLSGTANNSTIDSVHLTDCGEDTETPEHGEGLPVFVKTLEAEVIYS